MIAGIDVGSSRVTTLIATIGADDNRPKVIGVAVSPSRGIKKGQVVNIEEAMGSIVASVEAAERMAGYNLSRALVSLSGPLLTSQNSKGIVAVAQPNEEIVGQDVERVIDAARAVSLPSTREIIHVVPRGFTVDGQEGIKDPIGMSGVRLEVETHIVSGASTAIKNLSRCVTEVGADIQDLVVSSLASAQAVLTETEKELGVVLVDIGGGTTDVAIFVEGSPYYLSVIPVGANKVTDDLAIGARISLTAAEKLKIALSKKAKKITFPSSGEGKPKKKKDELDLRKIGILEGPRTVSKKTLTEGIIRPRLNEIFTLIGEEIKKSRCQGVVPAGVVLTGGGALTVGAVDCAKRILNLPVRIGFPEGVTGLVEEVNSPEFATSVGLAFYGLKSDHKENSGLSLGRFSKRFSSLPVGGVADRVVNLVKSFLP